MKVYESVGKCFKAYESVGKRFEAYESIGKRLETFGSVLECKKAYESDVCKRRQA